MAQNSPHHRSSTRRKPLACRHAIGYDGSERPKAAIVATAHKLARMVYHLLRYRLPFRDFSAADYEQRAREREIASLRNKAAKLGLALVESPA
jgi:hypothetical protein